MKIIYRKVNNDDVIKRCVITEKTMNSVTLSIKEKRGKISEINSEIHEIVKKLIPEHNGIFNTIGTWKCDESPIGLCYYDHGDDPALDHCLFCMLPDERK